MNIEAVTVCVNYSDFLQEVAAFNMPVFDRWIIVTDPSDKKTKALCYRMGMECIVSEDWKRDDRKFNKGRMVDRGLQLCSKDSWRLHIDADIALPAMFRHFLGIADLQKNSIYGCDRVNIQGYQQWDSLIASGYMHHTADMHHINCIELPKGLPIGARWASWRTGWVPLGFFQLWHASQDEDGWAMIKHYPIHQGDACHSDTQHAFQWDRKNRVFLPEVICVHIDSAASHTGANWNGRTTPPFRPGRVIQSKSEGY